MSPTGEPVKIRSLNCDQARAFDRQAIQQLGCSGLVLMENAGRACADCLQQVGIPGNVYVCCGKGNNGGDGYVIARHLALRGHRVIVVECAEPAQLVGDALANRQIWARLGGPVVEWSEQCLDGLRSEDWIVDALLGTGASGNPRSPFDAVIRAANQSPAFRFAVDLPSGLNGDTGLPGDPTIRADITATLVAPKVGMLASTAQPFVGTMHVADIGLPATLPLTGANDVVMEE